MQRATSPSALVTERGNRVFIRIAGEHYQLTLKKLRALLKLPPANSVGLGITIDRDRFSFEFADGPVIELSARQLQRRLSQAKAADVA